MTPKLTTPFASPSSAALSALFTVRTSLSMKPSTCLNCAVCGASGGGATIAAPAAAFARAAAKIAAFCDARSLNTPASASAGREAAS